MYSHTVLVGNIDLTSFNKEYITVSYLAVSDKRAYCKKVFIVEKISQSRYVLLDYEQLTPEIIDQIKKDSVYLTDKIASQGDLLI